MHTKEKLKNLLSSECANCSCRINRRKEKVNRVSAYGTTMTGNHSIVEAVSFVYKIPSVQLVANIQSYFINVLDDPLEPSDEIIQIFAQNFSFCGKCDSMFQEVHSAHKAFNEWSTLDNLLSKAIQHKYQDVEDTANNLEDEEIESVTDDTLVEIKSEEEDNEINSILGEEENYSNNDHNMSDFNEAGLLKHHEEIIPKASVSIQIKTSNVSVSQVEPPVVSENDSDLIECTDDGTIFKGPPYHCPKCTNTYTSERYLRNHCKKFHRLLIPNNSFFPYSGQDHEAQNGDILITDEFTSYDDSVIEGPPYYCPMCYQPYQFQIILDRHCKKQHQLLIPREKFLHTNVKPAYSIKGSPGFYSTTFKCPKCDYTTYDSANESSTFQCPKCPTLTTHDSNINGPPFQCPKCDKSFSHFNGFDTHCKFRHLLLLPNRIRRRKTKLTKINCSKCNSVFKNITGWKIHCRLKHLCNFFCILCTSCFATNNELAEHLKSSCKSLHCGTNENNDETNSSNETETEENSTNVENALLPESSLCGTNQLDISQWNIRGRDDSNVIGTIINKPPQPKSSKRRKSRFDISQSNRDDSIVFEIITSEQPPSKDKLPLHQLDSTVDVEIKKNRRWNRLYCNECKEDFLKTEDLKQHIEKAHYEKYVNCVRKSAPDINEEPAFVFNCTKCQLSFQKYVLLKKHSFEIHSIALESYEQRFFNYFCRNCDKLFETMQALSFHVNKYCDQSVKMYDCKFCSTRFNSSQKLSIHMKFVHDMNISIVNSRKNNYTKHLTTCGVCLKVFVSVRDLKFHKILSNENFGRNIMKNPSPSTAHENSSGLNKNTEIICQVCNIRFGNITGLKIHQRVKHKETKEAENSLQGPFDCSTCSKSFSRKETLRNHIRDVHLQKKKKCKLCHKQFSFSAILRHMRSVHIGYICKPYKCTQCEKTFESLKDLKDHEAGHNGDRRYVCYVCGKAFITKTQLKHHEETHSTHKLYVCERCGSSLKTRRTYTAHMWNHKQDDLAGPNPKCSECNEVFSNGSKLRHHKLIKHNKNGPVPCPICGKIFAFKVRVNYHMKAMHRESI